MLIMCVLGVVRYASESVDLACKYAYKDAKAGTTLGGILLNIKKMIHNETRISNMQ